MKKRPVNLEKSDENIADQYDNIFEGLQKDAGQNSWDAKLTKKGKDWKLIFRYIKDRNIIVIEDFGTTGMNEKKWIRYQSLWDTSKAERDALGARGQGKFLFHYFARHKLVLTETIDETNEYKFSYGTSEEWDDDKSLNDFIPDERPLSHQGTRIWIMNIKQELLDELLDPRNFIRYIGATWWEIIRNRSATFIVNFDGIDMKVDLPVLPNFKKQYDEHNVKIKNLGKIRSMVLRYCEEDVPEDLRGIAIQRGGMTILRVQVSAEESLKNRIYGHCNFDKDLEIELKKVEYPNHFGFRNKRAWNHVKHFVRRASDDFVQEIRPKKKKKMTISEALIKEAITLVNNIVGDFVPAVAGEIVARGGTKERTPTTSTSGGVDASPISTSPKPSSIPKPIPPIRIAKFKGNQKKIEYDESLIVDCEIVNGKESMKKLIVQLKIRHREGNFKLKPIKYNIQLPGKTREKIDIPILDFDEKKDKPGEYKATAMLIDDQKNEQLHKRSFKFYLHEEPPKSGRVFLNKVEFLFGKGTVIEKRKQLPVTEKGVLRIIWDHPDFVHIRNLAEAKGKRQRNRETLLYIVKCGVDGAIQKFLELKAAESQLDEEEIREVKYLCDEMYYEAIQSVEV